MSPHFSLTTPLYYVNALPHIGSAYTTIAADVLARFYRLQGYQVRFITGTDEHGQKIERTAQQRGVSPQAHCDEIAAGFQSLWQQLKIQYDVFSRTTSPRHQAIVNEFFQRLWDNGDIYLGQQQGWYCVECEEFKDERELLEGKRCPIHVNRTVEWRDERNYFFRLSKYQQALLDYYATHPNFVQPPSRRNEVLSFIERGLQDFSISRVNLAWGFAVPTDPEQTLYVWFDALLGYVTALLEPDEEPTLANALKRWWPINLHIIGKDILRFHAISWPAMLMSAGLPLPEQIFVHGFLTKDGQKMGKSLGNTLDPFALVAQYGADAVRYYFMKEVEFGRDGDFSETRFVNILNADLANDLGNLLNRTLKMAWKYTGGHVPNVQGTAIPQEQPLRQLAEHLSQIYAQSYRHLAFHEVCQQALTLARAGNKFLDEEAPWKRYKAGETEAVAEILYSVLESVRLVAYVLAPIIPQLSEAIYRQLGYTVQFNTAVVAPDLLSDRQAQWGVLPALQPLANPEPIFQKLPLPPTVTDSP
ncbi:MAG: methionine--tRNA ligase [Thermosynechococcus sp. Uc]|uniref:methionine--tRNA ligase n=1 Tax=Thermosynechococcus sp. Uc TaxID=3034853 RepID=UPI0019D8C012|nr:methionine--tRNA ligase [Thermosynechococcus sp. Uc]MDM7325788.1 methionine--tRNA ligase [Thermosynechococcus sp. Uc]HIK25713.1 methionine--tRNA ligase [Thermosynechococcus sp. M46_R2017_013]